jgi:predicted TIM-barrel fold metal-dependent hydrolase
VLIDVNTCFGKNPKQRVDWSPEVLVGELETKGIDRALACSLRGVEYDFVSGNEETLEICSQHECLIPVATIDPRRHFGCLDEVERCAERGFRVVRFFPQRQGWSINSRPFFNICEAVAEYGLAALLPAGPPGHQSLIGELIAPFGFNIVILGAGYGAHAETYAVTSAYENVFCDTQLFNTPGSIEGLAFVSGAHKLMYGSGLLERYSGPSYTMLQNASLSEDDRWAIFGGNAMEYLHLEGA